MDTSESRTDRRQPDLKAVEKAERRSSEPLAWYNRSPSTYFFPSDGGSAEISYEPGRPLFPYGAPYDRREGIEEVEWLLCERNRSDNCIGARVDGAEYCLKHLTPSELNQALKRIIQEGKIDARGTEIDQSLLASLFSAIARDESTPLRLSHGTSFERALFNGPIQFGSIVFESDVSFERAVFKGRASFDLARFEGNVSFMDSELRNGASFHGALFAKELRFERTRSYDNIAITSAQLPSATVLGGLFLADQRLLQLDETTFEKHTSLSIDVIVYGVGLDEHNFVRAGVSCFGTDFRGGLNLALRRVDILLERTGFGKSSIIWAPDVFGDLDRKEGFFTWTPAYSDKPRVLSLWATDVTNLSISGLLFVSCYFSGSIHLDHLGVDGPFVLAPTPKGCTLHSIGRRSGVGHGA